MFTCLECKVTIFFLIPPTRLAQKQKSEKYFSESTIGTAFAVRVSKLILAGANFCFLMIDCNVTGNWKNINQTV